MNKQTILTTLGLCMASIIFVACNGSKNLQTSTQPELKNTRWVVQSIDGNNVDSTKHRTAFVIFRDEGKMGGNSGCNSYGGNYTLSGDASIQFSGVFSTKMACMEEGNPENAFFAAFNTVNQYQINEDKLILSENGTNRIIFISTGKIQ